MLGALPTAAQATLAFVRTPFHPVVWVAEDDGSHAHKLIAGTNPHVSPDGNLVAFDAVKGNSLGSELFVGPADGSAPATKLMGNWREPSMLRWSPDSSTIAALRGPELGKRTLVLITSDGRPEHRRHRLLQRLQLRAPGRPARRRPRDASFPGR